MRDLAAIQTGNIEAQMRQRWQDAWRLLHQVATGTAGQNEARAFVGSVIKTATGNEARFEDAEGVQLQRNPENGAYQAPAPSGQFADNYNG